MVWGCFSYHDLLLLPPNTSVNTACYFTILMDHLHTSFDKCQAEVFQHDGAPAHTAKDIADWLADCGLQVLGNWPGNSPDLSPIENLWAIMKARLRSKDTSTLPKLQEVYGVAGMSCPRNFCRIWPILCQKGFLN